MVGPAAKVSGSYFGFDPTTHQLITDPANVWIDVRSSGSQIGVDYTSSSNSAAVSSQRNVFAPVGDSGIMVRVGAAGSCGIAGNLFGYHITGASLPPIVTIQPSVIGILITIGGTATVGTNADGVGDSNEGNWFGCMSDSGVENRGSGTTVAGNYFGFANAFQYTSTQPPSCTPTTWYLRATAQTIIGLLSIPSSSLQATVLI